MDLERVAAVIRPRDYAEAVDLGFRMARRWWRPIVGSWLVATLPLFVLLLVLLRERPLLALLIVWWLKPLFDRLPLFVLSRALFGALPTVRETLRAFPSLLGPDLILGLTLLRPNPFRSLELPVWQLERLRGPARRQRARLLAKGVHSEALRLSGTCVLFELCIWVTLGTLILTMIPDPDLETWFDVSGGLLLPLYAKWIIVLLFTVAMAVIEPFYVAAGFGLYLNRRTLLEAWDIEVAFRRMARRMASAVERRPAPSGAAVAVLLAVLVAPGGAAARTPPADPPAPVAQAERATVGDGPHPATVIQEVLAAEEFGRSRKVKGWRFKNQEEIEQAEPMADLGIGRFLAAILEPLLWLVAIAVAVFLIVQIVVRVRWPDRASKTTEDEPPDVLFGLDVREKSLPEDVVAAARELWVRGETNGAIRLLYRGALSRLISRDGLSVTAGATEGDCLRIASRLVSEERYGYFRTLTRVWQSTSYGHRTPEPGQAATLFEQWGPNFGVST